MSLPFYPKLPQDLQQYIVEKILPQYAYFDTAHQCDHAEHVIIESMKLSKYYPVKSSMVYAIAACHDLGLCEGREKHHEVSARIIRSDKNLRHWFTDKEIDQMAEAAEDHRASAQHAPRSIYGRIVAEADRLIDADVTIRRTIQYGLSHYPELNKEQHYQRMLQHLNEKYAEGGYLQLWIPESPNAEKLRQLRLLIADLPKLHSVFEILYDEEYTKIRHTPILKQTQI